MDIKRGVTYSITYDDIDKNSQFMGFYKGENKNGSLVFVSENYGHMLIIGKEDIIHIH